MLLISQFPIIGLLRWISQWKLSAGSVATVILNFLLQICLFLFVFHLYSFTFFIWFFFYLVILKFHFLFLYVLARNCVWYILLFSSLLFFFASVLLSLYLFFCFFLYFSVFFCTSMFLYSFLCCFCPKPIIILKGVSGRVGVGVGPSGREMVLMTGFIWAPIKLFSKNCFQTFYVQIFRSLVTKIPPIQ